MVRPAREGRSIPRLSGGALGYDPDVPTGETPDPVDHADTAAWEIPVAITEVQTEDLNAAHGTISTASTAYGAGEPNAPASVIDGDHDTQSVHAAFAKSPGSPSSWYWQTDLGSAREVHSMEVYAPGIYGWEYTDSLLISGSADASSWTDLGYSTTIGLFENNGVNGGTRTRYIYTLDSAETYRYFRLTKTIESAFSGSVTEDAMVEWKAYGDEVTGAALIWVDAFAINDGVDGTSDFVSEDAMDETSGVIARAELDTDVQLSTVIVRLATEDAGSRTLTLQGTDSSDFSSSVTIGSTVFTALGSYTAQDVTIAASGPGYRYLLVVLSGAVQNVRVHEVELTDTSGDVPDHDHDDRRWEPVTHNPGSGPELVWDGDDLVMEWKEY
jgi:hypothetical protein